MGGEFDLIARLTPLLSAAGGDLLTGPGDDAAVLALGDRSVCLSVDVLVSDVHFRRDLSSLADIGWKAVAVNCSDVAAMAGVPLIAVIGLSCPPELAHEEVVELYGGMRAAADAYGLRLVGGDTVAAPVFALSVTVLGDVSSGAVLRRGAQPGDRLVVVGALGAAAAALAQVGAGLQPDPELLAAHRRPNALVAAGAALAQAGATAMIDLSDGLGADLGHLCKASGVGAVVQAGSLPVAAGVPVAVAQAGGDLTQIVCGGGEDYALLAAVPASRAADAARAAEAVQGVPAAVVGEILPHRVGPVALLLGRVGVPDDRSPMDLAGFGFDHFRAGQRR